MDEDSSAEQKTWQVYNFRKRNVFRLRLNESREGFRRRKGWSFHVDGPKTEKAPEPAMESESVARILEDSIRNTKEAGGKGYTFHRYVRLFSVPFRDLRSAYDT